MNQEVIYSVSQLSTLIKRSIENEFADVVLVGEVSSAKVHTSGHVYFTLKDESSIIDCVCWKFTAMHQPMVLENGMEIKCRGKITTYAERSKYQLVVSKYELNGEGNLLKMLEELKKKLAAEGIFDLRRKREIPKFPKRIGVITSATGAVIKDIRHRVSERFPTPLFLYPVLVQGTDAANQIIHAIEVMNDLPEDIKPDVLIIARGGGSLEDLMPFNDESLVRCVAKSGIPTISAVGHETDTTLIDYAADLRAPTPTAAAELAVPDKKTLQRSIESLFSSISSHFAKDIQHKSLIISGIKVISIDGVLGNRTQRLDYLSEYLNGVLSNLLNEYKINVSSANLNKPNLEKFATHAVTLKLNYAIKEKLSDISHCVSVMSSRLNGVSFQQILNRGFAYIENSCGSPLKSINYVQESETIKITFSDGAALATINEKISRM